MSICDMKTSENVQELLRLVKDNPELPVLAFVDGEIFGGDDYFRWLGQIGECRIDEFVIDDWYGDGCVRFKSDNDDDTLIEGIAEYKYDGSDEAYKKAEVELKTLWTKVIVVNIDLPDDLI